MSRRRVLFICTGNSARSQMAEGLVNHFLGDTWEAFSAGIRPAERVNPLAVRVMGELGIDISTHRTKSVDEFRQAAFDVVVTVCDDAARNCPAWLGQGHVTHMGFPDPATADGSDEERLQVFREVRDAICRQVLEYLQRPIDEGLEVHFDATGIL